jgi:hypothetical protein
MWGFRRVLVALVGLFTLALVAPWGAPKAAADPTTTPPSTSGETRLGCGTFCQNAGGYGAAGGHAPKPLAITIVSTGTVTADADGYVPVTLKCDLSVKCIGALLLCLEDPAAIAALGGGMDTTCGRSDVLLDAGATRTFGAALPASAFAWLRSNSPTTLKVYAPTDLRQSQVNVGEYESLTGAVLMVAAA